jgi:hypothetical protein
VTLTIALTLFILQATPNPAPAREGVATKTVKDDTTSSADEFRASIEKQKAALHQQTGAGGVTDPFFTTPWITESATAPPLPCDPIPETDLTQIIANATRSGEVSPKLVRAVIRQESGSIPCAVSNQGAVGLMQLMPDTAKQFAVDPYDAAQNVKAGTQYLGQLLTRYKGNVGLALAAYNSGPERVDATGTIPDIEETKLYVEAILKEIEIPSDSAQNP